MNTELFKAIGLTPGEIKVYFALLKLGEATIGPLSKQAKVTAAKTYVVLEKLKEKGLVTSIIKSGTTYFQLLHPNRIIDFLGEKEASLQQQKAEIKKLIPSLVAQQKQEATQYATVYETVNGMRTLYDGVVVYLQKKKEDFIGFTLGEDYQSKEANLFFKQYDVKRREAGVKIRLIGTEYQRRFYEKEHAKDTHIEIRFIDRAVPHGVIIWGDNVAILLWHDIPTAFVIHSKQNADSYRKFFNDLWKIAKK